MFTVTTAEQSTQTVIPVQQQGTQTLEMAKDAASQSDTASHADTAGHPTTSSALDIGAELSTLIDQLQEEAPTRETIDSDWLRGESL